MQSCGSEGGENVESFTQLHKYSTHHISLLAKAFGCKNVYELMDFPTPEHDWIKVTVKHVYNESGTKVRGLIEDYS